MIHRRLLLAVALLLAAVPLTLPAPTLANDAPRVSRTGHVYLFRGFMNVFSTGMNDLTNEFRRNGIKADVWNHTAYQSVAAQAIAEYKASRGREPVFIVGHSLGADAAISMAQLLEKEKVPVAVLVTYDAFGPPVVPANVQQVINFHQYASDASAGAKLKTAPGFKGKVENVRIPKNNGSAGSVDHFNIDKLKSLHERTMKAVFAKSRRK